MSESKEKLISPLILIADDEQLMRIMIRDALSLDEYRIIEAENGQEAVRIFNRDKPDVVLLDGLMPVMDGFQACEEIRRSDEGAQTPILMITSLGDSAAVNKGFEAGVNDFIPKPVNLDILRRRLALILKEKDTEERVRKSEQRFRLLAENAMDCIALFELKPICHYEYISPVIHRMLGYSPKHFYSNPRLIRTIVYPDDRDLIDLLMSGKIDYHLPFEIRLFHKEGNIVYTENHIVPVLGKDEEIVGLQVISRDISERKKEEARKRIELTQKVLYETVKALSATIETRDPYTSGHQQKVAQLAVAIARELDLSQDQITGIQTAALLHDIGKITIPAEYLSKPGRLTIAEFNIIKTHTEVGYEILQPIDFPWPVAEAVWQHHERIDGSGYPCGLIGEEILLEAKILAVADVVEAMANHRPYRIALGIDRALQEIMDNANRLYDRTVVNACIDVFKKSNFHFIILE